jgi:ornithine cyclodeaminase/alanine dehydrogenase-like protein (mu-crystallin family)
VLVDGDPDHLQISAQTWDLGLQHHQLFLTTGTKLSDAAPHAEAGEIFTRTKSAPTGETTVFKSVGIAIEDVAAARLVYEASLPRGGLGVKARGGRPKKRK